MAGYVIVFWLGFAVAAYVMKQSQGDKNADADKQTHLYD